MVYYHPGALQIPMLGSNHQQMRNDARTKDVLNIAYAGSQAPYFEVFNKE